MHSVSVTNITSNLSEDNYTTPKAYIWKAIEAINKIISTLTSYITHGHKLVLQEDTPLLRAQAHTPFKINDQRQSHEHNPECGKQRWKIKLTHQGRDIFLNGSKNSSMPNSSDLWKNHHNHSLLTINSSANEHVRCTFLDNSSAPTLLVEVFISCKGPEEP